MKELLLEKCPDRHMEVAASNKEWSCLYFHLSPFNMVENLEYCFGRDSQGFSAILRTKVFLLLPTFILKDHEMNT